MEKINCPFCGKDYSHNRNFLQNHIDNICEKNPNNNYSKELQFFKKVKNKIYRKFLIYQVEFSARKIRKVFSL